MLRWCTGLISAFWSIWGGILPSTSGSLGLSPPALPDPPVDLSVFTCVVLPNPQNLILNSNQVSKVSKDNNHVQLHFCTTCAKWLTKHKLYEGCGILLSVCPILLHTISELTPRQSFLWSGTNIHIHWRMNWGSKSAGVVWLCELNLSVGPWGNSGQMFSQSQGQGE